MTSIHLRRLESLKARTAERFIRHAALYQLDPAELADAKLGWYEIRNQAGEGGEPATVLIYEEIGGSFGIQADEFARELQEITAATILLRINSPGGAVFDAIAIHNSLLHHPARVITYVDSLAASAASVIAMAGDEIVMMPGSQMMIHDASATIDGDERIMADMALWLGRQSDNIASIYQARAGDEVGHWRQLMLAETWMFAAEAVEMGLADRVEQRRPPTLDPVLDNLATRAHDLARFRYAGRQHAPPPGRRQATGRTTANSQRAAPAAPPLIRMSAKPSADERLRIGELRAKKLAADEPPLGHARAVCTQWQIGSRDARTGALAATPQRLRALKKERDGKQFHVVEGYATVYERGYEMWDEFGPYTEIVSMGAGDQTLRANPDVVFLVNHRGLAMARTVAGTLELWSDQIGMGDRAWLNPQRQDVMDLVYGIEDGTITEQSFAFLIVAGLWSADFTQFRIDVYDVDRGDTSAVNYGANPYTSITARAREILDDLDKLPAGMASAALDRLTSRTDMTAQARSAESAATIPAAAAPEPTKLTGRSVTALDAWLAAAGS